MTEEEVKTQTKVCTKCNIEKPITEFHKNKSKKDGLRIICKICANEYRKKRYQENSEYEKQINLQYRKNNNQYKLRNKKYQAKFKKKNPNYYGEYFKKHYQENPNQYKLRNKKYRAKKQKAIGNLTSSDIKKLNSYTNCYYCDCELNDDKELNNNKRHHDHFIPISRNGTEYIQNYRAVCQKCNLSKNNKLPHIWLKEQGLLEEYDRKSTEKYVKLFKKYNKT